MITVGLTGGIASGKSTISKELEERGAVILDADKVGHEVYQPGTEGFRAVREAFGDRVVGADGEIDRRVLGSIVFGDPAERKRLEGIVWPVMKGIMRRKLDDLRSSGTELVVLEAAVLLEAGWMDLVDQIWVVTVSPDVAESRLMARNGLTAEQAKARIAAQLTNEERTRHATETIDNSGSIAETIALVAVLSDKLVAARER